jgi:hypothetical protein
MNSKVGYAISLAVAFRTLCITLSLSLYLSLSHTLRVLFPVIYTILSPLLIYSYPITPLITGPRHPRVLGTMSNLAEMLYSVEQYDEALALWKELVRGWVGGYE